MSSMRFNPTSLYALVDCNNFYASCERAFKPALENKPIVVLSNNDGCVIARSNEAKKLGIPMGAPFFKWEKLCRQHRVHVFSSNYELYGDMSHRVMTLLAEHCPDIEIYSIDEAFLLLNFPATTNVIDFALTMRHKIKQCTGIPVSIGIASTKTLAKLANIEAKTSAAGVCQYQLPNNLLSHFPVEKIWGIGRQLAAHLNKLHIYTAEELSMADPKQMQRLFSVNVEKIIYELRGIPCLGLETFTFRKHQIISSRSFGKPLTNLADIQEAISHYAVKACYKLRKQASIASAIAVFLQTNSFNRNEPQYENSCCLPFTAPTDDSRYIITLAKKCIKHLYKKGFRYHKAGIILLDLFPNTYLQHHLFNDSANQNKPLMKAVDKINQVYGKETIFFAAEGIKRSWQIKSDKRSPRYTTQWDEILTVK